jgi:hypothetical protein
VQINRGLVFWGVALITAGAVALAIQAGAIPGETARQAWRLWPVVLIVIGLSIIAARTPFGVLATLLAGLVVGGLAGTFVAGVPDGLSVGCGGEAEATATAGGTFAGPAEVDLDFSCGELSVETAVGSAWSLEAQHGGDEPELTATGDSLTIRARGAGGIFGFADRRQAWDLVLPTDATLDLNVEANAASSRLDLDDGDFSALAIDANAGEVNLRLRGAAVDDLGIEANAGSLSIEADASTRLAGSVDMNAGSLELCVPDDANVAITLEDENVTFSHNLEERGFAREGDVWSVGSADPDVRLEVSGNAASFTLNPEDGCEWTAG